MSRSLLIQIAVASFVASACALPAAPPTPAPPPASAPSASTPEPAEPKAPAAKPEKLTVLCTPQEDWCQAMTKAFQEQFGIQTSYIRLSSGEALAKLRATKDNPEFSVWWGGPVDTYVAASTEDLLEPYVSPNAAEIPSEYKDPNGLWTGVYVGALGFCSNRDALSKLGVEKPDSWEDLLDPKLKGQVAMAHPASSGTAYTAVWTQVTRLGSVDAAFDYLKQLHQNILQYTKSGSAPGQMAGRGEVAVSVIFSHDCVKFADEGMNMLEVSFAAEGTGYEIGGVALIKGAPEPEAAKIWIDWVLTASAQEIGPTVKSYQLPTNPNAKVSERSVKLSEIKLVNYDFQEAGKNRKAITKRFEDEITTAPQ
jgi:iron(III) transport system substrate-binding protein